MKYGASANDYFSYGFYDKKHHQRAEYACWKLKKQFFRKMNDYSKILLFNDKVKFLKTFEKFAGREWLYVPENSIEEFSEFCQRHPCLVSKPINASCGKGVQIIDSASIADSYAELCKDEVLLEEVIRQHPDMMRMYPNAVNSIRVATVNIHGQVQILAATLRCGSGNGNIDNFHAGGIAVGIEPETGICISDGVNAKGERFIRHPDTNVQFHGFQIPAWDRVCEIVNEAARVVPGVNYTGWDVVVREHDAILIEGNFEGMFDVLQTPLNKGFKQKIIDLIQKKS